MLIKVEALEVQPEKFYTVCEKLYEKTDFFDYNLLTTFFSDIAKGNYDIWINEHILVLGDYKLYETGLSVMEFTVVNHSDDKYDGFVEDMKQLESFYEGIDRFILDGRAGWQRVFKDFNHSSTILYKDL